MPSQFVDQGGRRDDGGGVMDLRCPPKNGGGCGRKRLPQGVDSSEENERCREASEVADALEADDVIRRHDQREEDGDHGDRDRDMRKQPSLDAEAG